MPTNINYFNTTEMCQRYLPTEISKHGKRNDDSMTRLITKETRNIFTNLNCWYCKMLLRRWTRYKYSWTSCRIIVFDVVHARIIANNTIILFSIVFSSGRASLNFDSCAKVVAERISHCITSRIKLIQISKVAMRRNREESVH